MQEKYDMLEKTFKDKEAEFAQLRKEVENAEEKIEKHQENVKKCFDL